MRNYKRREVELLMRKNGYKLKRTKGSHLIYMNDEGRHISIGGCKFNGAIIHRLIKLNNLKV